MKTFQLEFTAEQIGMLFEMCEFASAAVGHVHSGAEHAPKAFCDIMSIQNKLDGCHDIASTEPSLLEQAGVQGTPWQIQELQEVMKTWYKTEVSS